MEYQYFEIDISDKPQESANDFWMCIHGVRACLKTFDKM